MLILQAPENVAFTFYGPNSIPVLGTLTSQAELLYEVFHLRSLPSSSMLGMRVMTYPACFLFFINLDYGALTPLIFALSGSSLNFEWYRASISSEIAERIGRTTIPTRRRTKQGLDWPDQSTRCSIHHRESQEVSRLKFVNRPDITLRVVCITLTRSWTIFLCLKDLVSANNDLWSPGFLSRSYDITSQGLQWFNSYKVTLALYNWLLTF